MYPPSPRFHPLALLIALVLCALVSCTSKEPTGPVKIDAPKPVLPEHIVDLSYAYDADTIYWPTDTQGFELEVLAAGETDNGYFYAANRFATAEHGGTHLDAPYHFNADGSTNDTIPLERLVGVGAVVDVTEKAAQDRDYQVTRADIEYWEILHGPLPEGVILLLRTGYGRFWGDRKNYLGTELTGPEAIPELHFPGLHPDTAAWLKAERQVKAIGLDTPSIDYGQSKLFESHVTLFEADIPVFENVANLDQLPDMDFLVVALPIKIAGGTGGPLRVIAYW